MNIFGLIAATTLGLSALALTVWALIAAKRIAKALTNGFEGIHFDL